MRKSNLIAALAMSGCVAFLSGCNDDKKCSDCEEACTTCDVETTVPASYEEVTPLRSYSPSSVAPADNPGLSSRQIEIRGIRDRLMEIERERTLYPDHAAELDAEASRLDMRLRDIDADMQKQSAPLPAVKYDNENIQVNDRSDLGAPLPPKEKVSEKTQVTETTKVAEPLPANEAPVGDLNRPLPPQDQVSDTKKLEVQSAPPVVEPAPVPEPAVDVKTSEEFKSTEVKTSESVAPPAVEPVNDVKPSEVNVDSDVELQKACEQLKKEAEEKGGVIESVP
jgi:hypothetical protein